ncbi:MAG: MFS transporter [Streptosporangiales bacterium]|nr:MFS transporter [Streptosporangiales bacterium]
MTEVPAAEVASSSSAGPGAKVSAGWIAMVSLANLAVLAGLYAPLQVLLPVQVENIAGAAGKVAALGWVTGFGSAAALITQPLVGAFSDRTTSRFGRRRPWALGGTVIGAAAVAALAGQRTVAGVIVFWFLAQAGLNVVQAAITAAVPDQVPVRQRGVASGWVSLQQALGVVVGVALVAVLVTGLASGYVALAVLVVVLALPFVFFTRAPRLAPGDRPPLRWGEFARSFWISPRRYPDFAWAWGTRFLIVLSESMAIGYLLYFLQDQVHYTRLFPGQTTEDGVFILIIAYAAGVLLSAVTGGIASDRSGRRKPLVITSGLVMAVPGVLLALWPTWTVTLIGAVLLGIGFGAYLAVDLALVTQVLPSETGHAKDLGIINIASTAPQVIAPAIAAPIVTSLGGYPALYLTVAVIGVVGSLLVLKIRSVA